MHQCVIRSFKIIALTFHFISRKLFQVNKFTISKLFSIYILKLLGQVLYLISGNTHYNIQSNFSIIFTGGRPCHRRPRLFLGSHYLIWFNRILSNNSSSDGLPPTKNTSSNLSLIFL